MPESRVLSGARARFLLDGIKVGYARSVNVNEEIDWRAIEVLDNIRVQEHTPTAYNCGMTAEQFRIVGETLKSRGLCPSAGANAVEHLRNIVLSGELTATLEDVITQRILATVESVRIASQNYTVNARDVTGENVTFVAILLKDESETTV